MNVHSFLPMKITNDNGENVFIRFFSRVSSHLVSLFFSYLHVVITLLFLCHPLSVFHLGADFGFYLSDDVQIFRFRTKWCDSLILTEPIYELHTHACVDWSESKLDDTGETGWCRRKKFGQGKKSISHAADRTNWIERGFGDEWQIVSNENHRFCCIFLLWKKRVCVVIVNLKLASQKKEKNKNNILMMMVVMVMKRYKKKTERFGAGCC